MSDTLNSMSWIVAGIVTLTILEQADLELSQILGTEKSTDLDT